MRKMIAAVAMLVVMAGSAAAQGGGGGGMGGGRGAMTPEQMQAMMDQQVGTMFKDITITDDQKKAAAAILTAAQAATRGIDRQAPDAAEQRAKVTTKRNEDLAAILKSDADKAKLAENIKNMPQGRGRGPGAR
jgi:Spy/CpxP family protein refolding chaperone